MTHLEAKRILQLYRRGQSVPDDPALREALRMAHADPELGAWFEAHRAFHQTMRERLQAVPIPEGLEARILAESKVARPVWWRQPRARWWAAAAALMLVAAWALVWNSGRTTDRFADWRLRMIRNTIGLYGMDVVTNRHEALREFFVKASAPADYEMPPALATMPLTGGGVVRWHNHPVAMVCFEGRQGNLWILYVIDRSAIPDAPPEIPRTDVFEELHTESWSQGRRSYLLMRPGDAVMDGSPLQ